MVTSGVIYHILRLLSIPVDIRNICVLLAPGFSGLTALAMYLLTTEMSASPSAGLLAAAFMQQKQTQIHVARLFSAVQSKLLDRTNND